MLTHKVCFTIGSTANTSGGPSPMQRAKDAEMPSCWTTRDHSLPVTRIRSRVSMSVRMERESLIGSRNKRPSNDAPSKSKGATGAPLAGVWHTIDASPAHNGCCVVKGAGGGRAPDDEDALVGQKACQRQASPHDDLPKLSKDCPGISKLHTYTCQVGNVSHGASLILATPPHEHGESCPEPLGPG